MSLRGLPLKRSIAFYESLRTMVRAGVPLTRTLDTLGKNVTPSWRPIVAGLERSVQEGKPLHEGMAGYGEVFPPLERAIVRAGETSGRMEENLEQIIKLQKRRLAMLNQIVVALIYPAILIHAAIFLPPMVEWFQHGLLAYAKGVLPPLVVLWGMVGGLFVFDALVRAGGPIASVWDRAKLGVPWLGGLFERSAVSRFTRCLGALHRSGVPLLLSLDTALAATGNASVRARLAAVHPGIQQGRTLSGALLATGAYPSEAGVMIETGEQSGAMDECLERVADSLDDDVQHSIQKLGKVLPIVFLLIAMGYGVFRLVGMLSGVFEGVSSALPD